MKKLAVNAVSEVMQMCASIQARISVHSPRLWFIFNIQNVGRERRVKGHASVRSVLGSISSAALLPFTKES